MRQLPTTSFLRNEGVKGVRVFCANRACGHDDVVSFDAIGAPPETRFPDLVKVRRFPYSACGESKVTLMPDWPKMRGQGAGCKHTKKRSHVPTGFMQA